MKKRIFAFVLVLGLLLAGCARSGDAETKPSGAKPTESLFGVNAQNKYRHEYTFIDFLETEDYFCGSSLYDSFLHFYEKASGISGILCADPACTHDSQKCNAYIDNNRSLAICEGKRYWVEHDYSTVNDYLMRSDLDGRNREKIKTISFQDIGLQYQPQWYTIHRGYLYFYGCADIVENGKGERRYTLMRSPVDDTEAFTALMDIKMNTQMERCTVRFVGDAIYVSMTSYSPEWICDVNITRYDATTGEAETVYTESGLSEIVGALWVTDAEELYLSAASEKQIHVWKIENGKRSTVFSEDSGQNDKNPPEISDGMVSHITKTDDVRQAKIFDLTGKVLYSGKLFPEGLPGEEGDPNGFGMAVLGGDQDKLVLHLSNSVSSSSGLVTQQVQYVVALDIHNNLKPTVLWSLEK